MMQLVRRIGHQVGVVVGRLNQYGLASGPRGLKLILEPDAVSYTHLDVYKRQLLTLGMAI